LAGSKKLTNVILKFYLHPPKKNEERKQGYGTTEASFDFLSTCLLILEFCFFVMLLSALGKENCNAGHCSRRPHLTCGSQIPQACFSTSQKGSFGRPVPSSRQNHKFASSYACSQMCWTRTKLQNLSYWHIYTSKQKPLLHMQRNAEPNAIFF